MKKNLSAAACTLACAVLTLAFSCKKEASNSTKPVSTNPTSSTTTDANFVTLDQAKAAALQAPSSSLVGNILKSAQIGGTARQLLDYTAFPDNTNPSLYIFNYVGGGFIVMSADKRVEPILAFSAKGHFSLSTIPTGVANWLTVNHQNMQVLRKNTTLTTPKNVALLWSELTPLTATTTTVSGQKSFMAQPPPPPCQPTYSSEQVGPLLQTTWAQGLPYNQNSNIPLGSYAYGDGRDPVGCVATAMGQVMYYWKSPTTYNWSIMPVNSETFTSAGETEVSRLMYNIGLSVGMVYGNESGPSSSDNSVPANGLKSSYFHYGSASEVDYNNSTTWPTVMSNLNAHEPVLLSGYTTSNAYLIFGTRLSNGHCWVCDGYWQVSSTWCPSNGSPGGGETFLYFDMNWGWNEGPSADGKYAAPDNVDGWYDFNSWSVNNSGTQENFQYGLSMIDNIHP